MQEKLSQPSRVGREMIKEEEEMRTMDKLDEIAKEERAESGEESNKQLGNFSAGLNGLQNLLCQNSS